MRLRHLVVAALGLLLLPGTSFAASDFESSKMTSGIVTEGTGFQSSKLSPGVVVEDGGFQSSKLSPGVVVENGALQSSKLSVGIVVQLVPVGGLVQHSPLTHW
jgi:hypothetical protein